MQWTVTGDDKTLWTSEINRLKTDDEVQLSEVEKGNVFITEKKQGSKVTFLSLLNQEENKN